MNWKAWGVSWGVAWGSSWGTSEPPSFVSSSGSPGLRTGLSGIRSQLGGL